MIVLKEPLEFEWDQSNQEKNWQNHQVNTTEIEEVFFSQEKQIAKDILHSKVEDRYLIIGTTKSGRKLFIIFTLRKEKNRVISVRDLNKREYKLLKGYHEKTN